MLDIYSLLKLIMEAVRNTRQQLKFTQCTYGLYKVSTLILSWIYSLVEINAKITIKFVTDLHTPNKLIYKDDYSLLNGI